METKTARRKVVRGIAAVGRAIGVSPRTAARLLEDMDHETGEKHPLGILMFRDGEQVCIELRAVEDYFNRCRALVGLQPIAPISPVWGKARIAAVMDVTVSKVTTLCRGIGTSDNPLTRLIWHDEFTGKPVICEHEYLAYLARASGAMVPEDRPTKKRSTRRKVG